MTNIESKQVNWNLSEEQIRELSNKIVALCKEYNAPFLLGIFSVHDTQELNLFVGNICPVCAIDKAVMFGMTEKLEHTDVRANPDIYKQVH